MAETTRSSEVLTVLPLYENEEYSEALITLHGVNTAIRNRICQVTYTPRGCGTGLMVVEGRVYELREGKSVTVEPDEAYQDMSVHGLTMIARSVPPYTQDQVEPAPPQLTAELISGWNESFTE